MLYTGRGGLVAHECILDLRPITKETGVTVDDVAKRLIDYGFHAPTMSFPVAGHADDRADRESEDLAELDRFFDAMIAIRGEIDAGRARGSGRPTTTRCATRRTPRRCVAGEWAHPYPREVAAFPVRRCAAASTGRRSRRIDGAYGDRNLVCAARRRRRSPSPRPPRARPAGPFR